MEKDEFWVVAGDDKESAVAALSSRGVKLSSLQIGGKYRGPGLQKVIQQNEVPTLPTSAALAHSAVATLCIVCT